MQAARVVVTAGPQFARPQTYPGGNGCVTATVAVSSADAITVQTIEFLNTSISFLRPREPESWAGHRTGRRRSPPGLPEHRRFCKHIPRLRERPRPIDEAARLRLRSSQKQGREMRTRTLRSRCRRTRSARPAAGQGLCRGGVVARRGLRDARLIQLADGKRGQRGADARSLI